MLRGLCSVSSLLPLVPNLMIAPAESRLSRTSNNEAIPDIIPNIPVRGDDCEQIHPANTKILQRATLKIDSYLIPIMGMFCVFFIPTFTSSQRLLLSAHLPILPFRSFVILGEWFNDRPSGGFKTGHGCRIDRMSPL
jgi:hypothetical protein